MPDHSRSASSVRCDASLHSSQHIIDSASPGPHIASSGIKIQHATVNDDSSEESEAAPTQHGSHHRFWATVPPSATVDSVDPSPGTSERSIQPSSEDVSEESFQQHQQMVLRNRQALAFARTNSQSAEMLVPAPHLRQQGDRTQVGIPGVMGREHQSRILFVSLLESYCRTYDDDPLRNRRLFFAICRTLYSMGIIGKEYVDEMSSIRATYSGAFRQLVAKAQESLDLYEQHDIETGIRSLMTGVAEDGDESSGDSFEPDNSGSTGGWTVSDSDSEFDQTTDEFCGNRAPRCDSVGGSERHTTTSRQAVPIAPQQGRSRRNTVSNFGNASYTPRPAPHKHSYPRTHHSTHRGSSYGQSLHTNGGSARGVASSTLSGASGNSSAPTTFESMIIDMQRSRYHDDFIQLRCLGKGGFGKVYEVRNKLDGRRYAVKQIKIKGEITAEKTLREIKTLAHLDHPNIVRYYSSWIEVTRLRKRISYNSNEDGGVLGISPQSHGSASQRHGPRNNQTVTADPAEDRSFALSTDDDVSFCLTGTQDGCFEMSLTGDGDSNNSDNYRKVHLVEDSALESLDDTSGYSLWRTANLQDTVIDDSNGNFSPADCGIDGHCDNNNSNDSSCQISFVDYGEGNETDNDVVFVANGDRLKNKDGCASGTSTAICGSKSCPSISCATKSGTPSIDQPECRAQQQQQKQEDPNSGNKGHRRRKSMHVVGGPYLEDNHTAKSHLSKFSRSPQSLYDSFASTGHQAQSLPSQGMMALSGIVDAGQQALVAETSLLVQMQLCQTTLQEFLMQRNERIAKRQAVANANISNEKHSAGRICRAGVPMTAADDDGDDDDCWCPMREHDLLIDPVMNIRLFRAIVEGVKYFHNRGVIHRDLKGANVFLDIVYSDSGGNPISRGGSGIGRPDTHYQHQQQSQLISSLNPLSRVMNSGGLVSVHSDIWDAVDGGNLKEKIHATSDMASEGNMDRRTGSASAPAMTPSEPLGAVDGVTESRKVDWDSIFESILAHRSIDGTAHGSVLSERANTVNDSTDSGGGDNDGDGAKGHVRKTASSSHLSPHTGQQSVQLPPAVSFIPRIGDFGLATKSTLGIRASGDEYAFIGNAKGVSTKQSSSSSIPSDNNNDQDKGAASCDIADACACDTRRTSNVGTITYAAPEQLSERATDYSEKADIYSLGIIFFEMYYPFATAMERIALIRDLRRGVFPPQFLQMWPKEAALILQLMDADPTKRPSAKEILSFDLIDVPTLESAQLKREVNLLRQQLRMANQRNEELGLRVRELERIVDMSI
ncbi:hypothetical protein EV178_004867 [Coemansia sp. RSA 1646]|nr:hypothetical protein EV178_004867 [Coemansia sp. RSA 1646]KAJ2212335.1 hypothetical protein EV179_004730 [Coemansia sp. RSA 487]